MTTACFEGHSKSIKVKMKVAFIKFDGFFFIVVTWKATANPKKNPNEVHLSGLKELFCVCIIL